MSAANPLPNPDSVQTSPKTKTFTGAVASANSIKTSVATVAAPASYTGNALNGSIGQSAFDVPRTVSVTTSANTGSYNTTNPIVITGQFQGAVQTESLKPTSADGGETIAGVKPFDLITEIDTPAQNDTGGHFQFGTHDVVCAPQPRGLRIAQAGDLALQFLDGATDTILSVGVGEYVPVAPKMILAATTAQKITMFF